MKRLLGFSAAHPLQSITLLILLAALSVTQLSKLEVDISAQSMMVKTDPLWLSYQRSLQTFGSDNVAIIYVNDPELFSSTKLKRLEQTVKELEILPFIKGSSSLFNVPNVREDDGFIYTKPFLETIPDDDQSLNRILLDAVSNPLVVNNLISPDGQTMAINLFLDGAIHYPGRDTEITQAIEAALIPLHQEFDEVFQMGASYVRDAISGQIANDQQKIVPLALLVLLFFLGVGLKRFNCAIVPLITAGLSIMMTLAVMASLGISINVLTSIIPALLIIIGSTEDIHLLTEYHRAIDEGYDRSLAVETLPNNQSLPILLTFITTFVGFLSITVNDLEILTQFGWMVSLGLLLNFLITVLFIPGYLKVFGSRKVQQYSGQNRYQQFAAFVFKWVIRFKRITLAMLVIVALIFSWGIQYLEVNNNTLGYFEPESEINQRALKIHQNLSGMQTFSIILDSGIDDTFLKVRYLEDVRKIQTFLDQRNVFDKNYSFADFIMLTNKVMEGTSELSMPVEDDLVRSYMGLVQFDSVKNYVSSNFSQTRILVRHNLSSSRELAEELEIIRTFVDKQLQTRLSVEFTGESVLTNKAADSMAIGQIQSLLLMVVVILILVSALFIDIRAGLLAIVPNVYPVIILFGVMGYFNIALDTGTTMVAVIALGICVDDTIHFLSRYHHYTRGNQDVDEALLKTVKHESTPIITTSVSLALGFTALSISSFQPVVHFGLLSALVMVLAMVSTFILTPILLSYTRLITVWDMLSLNLRASVLKNSAFFQGLRELEIKKAVLSGDIKQFDKDDLIVEQGQEASDMYVILEGSARVTRKSRDSSVHTLGELEVGDIFGEMALLINDQRTARVTANGFVKVLVLKWFSLNQLGRFHPRISMKLFRNLSGLISLRMAHQSDHQLEMRDEHTGAVTKPFLFEQLTLELDRCKRYSEQLSLIMLDIDFLDAELKLGLRLREKAIKSTTHVLAEQTRAVDIFARWSENRFVVLMPRTHSDLAVGITSRMKQAIEDMHFDHASRLHITAAITQASGEEMATVLLDELEQDVDDLKKNQKSLNVTILT